MKRELSWALRALYQRKYRTDQNAISQLQRKANNVLGDPPTKKPPKPFVQLKPKTYSAFLKLLFVVRHSYWTPTQGVTRRPDGYAKVIDVMRIWPFNSYTKDKFQKLVDFGNQIAPVLELKQHPLHGLMIRATGYHSQQQISASYREVPLAQYENLYYSCDARFYEHIMKHGIAPGGDGLIHLYPSVPSNFGITYSPGKRVSQTATILLSIDVAKLIEHQVALFEKTPTKNLVTTGTFQNLIPPQFIQNGMTTQWKVDYLVESERYRLQQNERSGSS